jgi:hypothetical protein
MNFMSVNLYLLILITRVVTRVVAAVKPVKSVMSVTSTSVMNTSTNMSVTSTAAYLTRVTVASPIATKSNQHLIPALSLPLLVGSISMNLMSVTYSARNAFSRMR